MSAFRTRTCRQPSVANARRVHGIGAIASERGWETQVMDRVVADDEVARRGESTSVRRRGRRRDCHCVCGGG